MTTTNFNLAEIELDALLKRLHLPNMRRVYSQVAAKAEEEQWSYRDFLALLVAVSVAIPIGIYSAIRQDTAGDYTARSFSLVMLAVPNFWLGTLVMVFPSVWWRWSPPLENAHPPSLGEGPLPVRRTHPTSLH